MERGTKDKEETADIFKSYDSFIFDRKNFSHLKELCLQGKAGSLRIRTFCWRLFLGIIPNAADKSDWIRAIRKTREEYDLHRESINAFTKTTNLDPNIYNPLMKPTADNPWSFLAALGGIKDQIHKDVERTNQEMPFFQAEENKSALTDVLILWAGKNPETQYRQGMNELAALVLLVFSQESLRNPYPQAADKDLIASSEKLLYFLNDANYIQADVYAVFHRMMKLGVKQLYVDQQPSKQSAKGKAPIEDSALFFAADTNVARLSQFNARCYRINRVLLREADAGLYKSLESKKLAPPMFLLRWLRCVLCREFEIKDVLVLWDAIFANIQKEALSILSDPAYAPLSPANFHKLESDPLSFLEILCTAMIVQMKRPLLDANDGPECMSKLLKFPAPANITSLVESAMTLRSQLAQQKSDSPSEKKQPSPAHAVSGPSSSWISNSINFFSSGPQRTRPPNEERTTVPDGKPASNSVIEKIDACLVILADECAKSKNSDELEKCIDMLQDVKRDLK